MPPTCCASSHPLDVAKIRERWWPATLRCLVIGESPGSPGAAYFYDPLPHGRRDPVEVRRKLLAGLAELRITEAPTLEAFKTAGFLFDHAIRCQLPSEDILLERRLAGSFRSPRAHHADHLRTLVDTAPKVWVMGAIARDAVANLYAIPPRAFQRTLHPPSVPENYGRFFVSQYLNRYADVRAIIVDFECFLGERPLRRS